MNPIPFYTFTIPLSKKEDILPQLTEFCDEHGFEMRVIFYEIKLIKIQMKKIKMSNYCENTMLGISKAGMLFGSLFAVFLIVKIALVWNPV